MRARATRDHVIGVRITPAVKAALRYAAEVEDRTISKVVERVVTQWLIKQRFLTEGHLSTSTRPRRPRPPRGRRG